MCTCLSGLNVHKIYIFNQFEVIVTCKMADLLKNVLELLELMKQHKSEAKADFENLLDSQTHEPPSVPAVNVAKLVNGTPSTKFPRISLFYGVTGKGEFTYRTWRYEVNLFIEGKYIQ